MSEQKQCEHGMSDDKIAWLDNIEYNETNEVKKVALTFECGYCGSKYTQYWSLRKTDSEKM